MQLRGVNLGGWLLMEGYILGGRNIPEYRLKHDFARYYGKKELKEFERLFRDNFIREDDFRRVASLGAGCVRIPFHYRLLEKRPFVWDQKGFEYIRKSLRWGRKYGVGVILDLHAAAGAQNADWHSDSSGTAHLWESPVMQRRTYWLWENIADRVKDEGALLGYDVLNEPVVKVSDEGTVKRFYRELVRRIRRIDKRHFIFLEGNMWAQRIDFLAGVVDERTLVSVHFYQPLNFVFNFHRGLSYPGTIDGCRWDKYRIEKFLGRYYNFMRRHKTDIFVGEFGINSRRGSAGELEYLKDVLSVFEEYGFGYTYWTYKSISSGVFPSGIYEYFPNSSFVRRQGPVYGWENYLDLWGKDRKRIVDFWRTDGFNINSDLAAVLKMFFRKR